MTKPIIMSEVPINIAHLKKELEKIKKRDNELNFRANKTDEYIKQIVSLDVEKAEELYKKIENLKIPRFKDLYIHKIIDLMPTTIESLKVTIQGYAITVNNENLKKIVEIVNEFSENKKK